MKYYQLGNDDENARYKSWEHCHSFFLENRTDPDKIDLMCLHLAFYLASWGMLRGRSFLLQKDYLVHKPAVEIILNTQYSSLWDCSSESLHDNKIIELIFACSQRLITAYKDKTRLKNGTTSEGDIASDTLITKILLGTFGCTPAFDRYFRSGMKIYGLDSDSFSRKNLKSLAALYMSRPEFKQAEQKIQSDGLNYPPAKLLDMFFWQLGFDAPQALSNFNTEKSRVRLTVIPDPEPESEPDSAVVNKRPRGSIQAKALDYIHDRINQATIDGKPYIDLVALEIAKGIQIPNSIPSIIFAMRKAMRPGDQELSSTPSGMSSTKKVRYLCKE